jgi:hypothetical protein
MKVNLAKIGPGCEHQAMTHPHSVPPSDEELPPPPPLLSFMERSFLSLGVEMAVGGAVGWILGGAEGILPGSRTQVAMAGALLAPLTLLLTPVGGAVVLRALRYGLSLAVLGTLLVSFTGPGHERPLDEVFRTGILLLVLGVVGHGLRLLVARNVDIPDPAP